MTISTVILPPEENIAILDLQPYETVQAIDRDDILNMGGFSDRIFNVVSSFIDNTAGSDYWVDAIEALTIN